MVLVVVGACAVGDGTGGDASDGRRGVVEAELVSSGSILVPATVPEELHLVVAASSFDHGVARGVMELWEAPSEGRRAAERAFAVVLAPGEEPSLPGSFTPDAVATDPIRGRDAVTGRTGDLRWLSWQLPYLGAEIPKAAVVGRGLSDGDLRRIAESVDADAADVSLHVGWAPEDLEPVATAAVSAAALAWERPYRGAELEWRSDEGFVRVVAVARDEALAALLRFAINDPDRTEIRGETGVHGESFLPGFDDDPTQLWAWTEDDLEILVQAHGVDTEVVTQMIESMRPLQEGEWEKLATEASRPAPADVSDQPPPGLVLQGSFDGGAWTVTYSRRDGSYDHGFSIRHVDGSFGHGGGGGSVTDDRPSLGICGDDHGWLFFGSVPAEATSLVVEFTDGARLEPKLHQPDGSWAIRAWAAWVDSYPGVARVTAHRSDGTVAYEEPVPDFHRTPMPANGCAA